MDEKAELRLKIANLQNELDSLHAAEKQTKVAIHAKHKEIHDAKQALRKLEKA